VCGLFGSTDPDWDYADALRAIVHRGPDAEGLGLDGPVKVGFRLPFCWAAPGSQS